MCGMLADQCLLLWCRMSCCTILMIRWRAGIYTALRESRGGEGQVRDDGGEMIANDNILGFALMSVVNNRNRSVCKCL